MPATSGNSHLDGLSRRWHDLAARRLLSYAELYRSGRWTRYFATREQFVSHLARAVKVETIWARLADRTSAADGDLHTAA